jgi:hypothetical protein
MAHKVFMAIAAAVTVALTAIVPSATATAEPTVVMANGTKFTPTLDYPGHCTMGPVGYDNAGRLVGITAGHCTPNGGTDPVGGPIWNFNQKDAGPVGYIAYNGKHTQNTDYLVVVFDPTKVVLSSTSPGGVRVDKLPTKAKPSTFSAAKKDGATSGVTTGFVCSTYPTYFNSTATLKEGDSGSAMTDGKGAVTGINVSIDWGLCLNKSLNIGSVLGLINSRGTDAPGAGFVPINN